MLTMVMSRDHRGLVRFHPVWNADAVPITHLVPDFRIRCEKEGNTYIQSWVLRFAEPLPSLMNRLHAHFGASFRMLCAAVFSQGYEVGFRREALPRQPPSLGPDFGAIRDRLHSLDHRADLLLAAVFASGYVRGTDDAPPASH